MTRSHRDEFGPKVRDKVFARATRKLADGRSVRHCESPTCGAVLKPGEGEIDHIIAVAFNGKPTFENARLLCKPCHASKTALDVKLISKAKRNERAHTGAKRPSRQIRSPSFDPSPKSAKRAQKARDHEELRVNASKLHAAWERRT